MASFQPNPQEAERINTALCAWRQGDVALDAQWFLHAADPQQPLTTVSAQSSGEGPTALTSEVEGVVVVTQTCDIVRACTERPFVEVVPLVQVDARVLQEVQKGRRPAYAYIPTLAARQLVADLDRVMTVEKSLVASWTRTPGWETDPQARELAQALARKRVRFAFPDDFTHFVRKLQGRLQEKHEKQSEEGRALRALREIRVSATPSWEAPDISLTFWFILDEDPAELQRQELSTHLDAWLALVPASGRFKSVSGFAVMLEDMTAKDYVESDRLDLDHLSSRGRDGTSWGGARHSGS